MKYDDLLTKTTSSPVTSFLQGDTAVVLDARAAQVATAASDSATEYRDEVEIRYNTVSVEAVRARSVAAIELENGIFLSSQSKRTLL